MKNRTFSEINVALPHPFNLRGNLDLAAPDNMFSWDVVGANSKLSVP